MDHTLPSGRWEEQIFRLLIAQNIAVWGGEKENGTLQVAFLSRNTQLTYPTSRPERYFSSVALSFLPAPPFASVVHISLTMYFI